MGGLSNQLLVVTILLYIFAMLAYAVEYAFANRTVGVPERELAAVGAGSVPDDISSLSDADGVAPVSPAPGDGADSTGRAGLAVRIGIAGVVLSCLGVATHAATLVTRGLAAHRVPWGNMYEFVMAVTLVGSVAWLVVLARRPQLRRLGLFVSLVVSVLLGLDGMVLYAPAGPLVPALNSYWLFIHVTAATTASGLLMIGFIAASLHLVRYGYDAGKRRFPYSIGERLPDATTLERLTFRVHAFAFPIWTFAIMCGAIWAEAAWGRYWGWDPKETWSFIAWVIYACYLHARSTPSIKRWVVSSIAVVGWAAMLINLVFVNMFASSFHSYSGLK